MDSLQAEFQKQIEIYLKSVQDKVAELFKQGIEESVYQSYNPIQYDRTYTFLNSTRVKLDLVTGKMFVYTDINEGANYYSAVDGSPQFENISNFLENGHNDGRGSGEYHNYKARNYLERCYELIHNEFP